VKLVGYGVMTGDKAVGIWPIGWTHARARAAQYQKERPDKTYTVVPIYIGAPISVHPTATTTEGKEHA
jgi:hypothetical protein